MKSGFRRDHIRINPLDKALCKKFAEIFLIKNPVKKISKMVKKITKNTFASVDETFALTVTSIEVILDDFSTSQEEIVKNYIDQLKSKELESRLTELYWP